ncbi:MAG: 4Fe-4S dicluster domain-containing protein [Victivallaceae bacterium]
MKLFSMFGDICRNLVCGPATRNYPAVKRDSFPGERGRLAMDAKSCIYCGLCMRKCPANAIKVNRKPDASWQFERFRCVLCGACVEVCPKKCLKLVGRLDDDGSTK